MADTFDPRHQFHKDLSIEGTGVFDDLYCIGTDQAADSFLAKYLYYINICTWFSNMGMPLPNIASSKFWAKYDTLEWWTAVMDFGPFKAAIVFMISNSFFFSLVTTYFLYRYNNLTGSEGFFYTEDPDNREEVSGMNW